MIDWIKDVFPDVGLAERSQ